jgi:hypothetical protein
MYTARLLITDTCGYTATAETSIDVRTALNVNIVGNGSISKVPNQTTYAAGQVITLTAVADSGWAFAAWDGDLSSTTNPTTITMDSNKAITATFAQFGPSPGATTLFLPMVLKSQGAAAPDLTVESLTATSNQVEVVIKNWGSAPVTDAFWVDVYFDPSVTPSLNQPWDTIASHGVVWGVTTSIPAGGSLTLITSGDYYFPEYSSPIPLPVGANVYALVDSINYDTTYGAVRESDEGNNLFGPVTSTTGTPNGVAQVGAQGQPPAVREELPPRQ